MASDTPEWFKETPFYKRGRTMIEIGSMLCDHTTELDELVKMAQKHGLDITFSLSALEQDHD